MHIYDLLEAFMLLDYFFFFLVFYPESILECFCCLSHFRLAIILKLFLLWCMCGYHILLCDQKKKKINGDYELFAPVSNLSIDGDLDIMY
jgi:hypothetical protein